VPPRTALSSPSATQAPPKEISLKDCSLATADQHTGTRLPLPRLRSTGCGKRSHLRAPSRCSVDEPQLIGTMLPAGNKHSFGIFHTKRRDYFFSVGEKGSHAELEVFEDWIYRIEKVPRARTRPGARRAVHGRRALDRSAPVCSA